MKKSSRQGIPQQPDDSFANKINNLSYIGNWFTIIGTFIAVILGIWSLILTVQVGKSSVRIEKMDSVIQLLSTHGISQAKQIAALEDLQKLSVKILDRNTSQLFATKEQTSYLVTSEKPQIQLENYAIDSISPSESEEIITFKNYGRRAVVDLKCDMYYFEIGEKKMRLLSIKHIERNIGKYSNHETLNQYDTLNKTIFVSSAEVNKNYYEVIDVSYHDPLNMRVIKSLFYIKRYKQTFILEAVMNNGDTIQVAPPIFIWDEPLPRERVTLEKAFYKTSKK